MKTSRPFLVALLVIVTFLFVGVGCDGLGPNPPPDDGLPSWAVDLISSGEKKALKGLLTAAHLPAPDWLVNPVIGKIMGTLFAGGAAPGPSTDDMLRQMQSQLADIEKKLDAIMTQLGKIEDLLKVSTAEIESSILAGGLDPYIEDITSLWAQFQALHNPDDGTWVRDPVVLRSIAKATLNINEGLFKPMQALHDYFTGQRVHGSTLAAVADVATLKTQTGHSTIFASYMLMENYFGKILQMQTKGATLMVEALKLREVDPQLAAAEGLYPGTAVTFMNWHIKQVEDEVEWFLRQTEAFVAATAFPQKGFDDFVPDADTIFWRADLIAAWLSSKHRLDPNAPPDGQQFMVYRVIGGSDRVNRYGASFPSGWGQSFKSISYEDSGQTDPQNLVPIYQQVNNNAYDQLQPGVSPFVQFAASSSGQPGNTLLDASEIATGAYCVKADVSGTHWLTQPYYLADIPTHASATVAFARVDSAGHPVLTTGSDDRDPDEEEWMIFGYVLDVQHPPAQLMGTWKLRLSHSDQSSMQSLKDYLDGGTTPGSQWVYLGVDAWPTFKEGVSGDGHVIGSFDQEYALECHWNWVGSGSPTLQLNWTGDFVWEVRDNGYPQPNYNACGLGLWLQGPAGQDASGMWTYFYTGNGADILSGANHVTMAPNTALSMSFGPHMEMMWHDQYLTRKDSMQKWNANYSFKLTDLMLTLH